MSKKHKILFFTIILIAAVVRLLFLTTYPSSLTQDEIAIGYNAYSILETGRDEWGQLLPLNFKSVGDFKPPVLIYLTVPFIAVFGKTALATRLPVALFSIFTIILFFFFSRKHIFSSKHPSLPYLATTLLALSPWHIFFSRSGFEAILGVFLSLACVYLLLDFFIDQNFKNLTKCLLVGFIAIISYHSVKVFLPILCLLLLIFQFKKIKKFLLHQWQQNKRELFLFLIFAFLLIFIFSKNYIFGDGSARAKMTFLSVDFDYQRLLLPQIIYDNFSHLKGQILLVLFWLKRYLEYFLPNFYLYSGLGLVSSGQPGQGVIYSIELIFLSLGFLFLLSEARSPKYLKNKFSFTIIILWLLIGFLPASLANNSQHALRSLNAIPAIYSLIALGLYSFYLFLSKKFLKLKYLLPLIFTMILLVDISKFIDFYSTHYPYQLSEYRQYGWKEVAIFAEEIAPKYNQVIIDPRFGTLGQDIVGVPYLYFLFYSNHNPAQYNSDPRRLIGNSNFSNFKFESINWFGIDHAEKNLYVGSPWSFPGDQITPEQILYQVYYPNGKLALMVIEDKQ